jgi:hypothetical protein
MNDKDKRLVTINLSQDDIELIQSALIYLKHAETTSGPVVQENEYINQLQELIEIFEEL